MNLSEHPLLMQSHALSVEVDRLPPHDEQTAIIVALQAWRERLYAHLKAQGLLVTGVDA